MKLIGRFVWLFFLLLTASLLSSKGQAFQDFDIVNSSGLFSNGLVLNDSNIVKFSDNKPLCSFLLNGARKNSGGVGATMSEGDYLQIFDNKLIVTYRKLNISSAGWVSEIVFQNTGDDTINISNVVPFGEDDNSIYITGMGPDDPARAWLFRPGRSPVRVILPDNGWESGYSSFSVGNDISVCALARRTGSDEGVLHRYSTDLPPEAHVTYTIYADIFKGEWQNGLRLMFRDNYFYDLSSFDNTLYEREDLAWIKESYLIVLYMAWDRQFYDRLSGKYTYPDIIKNGIEQFGKIDVVGIWPTWPRIGLDQRNQWDLYRDLPGGTEQLKAYARMSRMSGTKFFIAYNPWDKSTRKEDHYRGMARVIYDMEADGVVLDTRGSSGVELQAVADTVRKGVVMYSEGMAVPADMPGIISGRVHNAIFYSPELNLNKLIKPDFSIFRVCDVGEDVLHRELAVAFFNGYGVELNMFRPGGRGEEYFKDLDFLARTTFILRQNNDAFLDYNWTPMVETFLNRVFINRWKSGEKTVFTVLNMRSEGVNGNLLRVDNTEGKHYVSLWNHENLVPIIENGVAFVKVNASGWHSSFSGTRKEGSLDCIAELPDLIKSKIIGDSISISKTGDGTLMIWKGNPSYKTTYKELRILNDTTIRTTDLFGKYEGKIVLQLLENKRLKDENILMVSSGEPMTIRNIVPSERASYIPADMVLVPGSKLSYNVTYDKDIFPYPDTPRDSIEVDSFLIDKFPVTNARYYEFMINSRYMPTDTTRFLKHWVGGTFRQGQDNYPVVYVSYEDMVAYAEWSGKRLPGQFEWQLAAQGTDGRKWPWGDEFHGTYCNNTFNRPTPVNAFPKGQSPYGVHDLVGNVWQMTSEMYYNGTNYFSIIRGGSFFKPESSSWYLQGGPQPLDKIQMLLMVSQGFDRSETVGFRCVKDIDSSSFTDKKPRR